MSVRFPQLSRSWRVLALLALGCHHAPAADLAAQWLKVGAYDSDGPHGVFARTEGREARLGEAVTLLNLQPKTARNIERAALLLDEVAGADSGDELGISARYLRARLEEVHRPEAQPAEAARRYQEIIRTGGAHPLAQQAAVRLSLLQLYPLDETNTPSERVASAEALGAGLGDPAAIRDHAMLVGQACLYYQLPLAQARRHLERALAAGILNPSIRADLLVTLGEIARELGDAPSAEQSYRAYLRENPQGDRTSAVKRRLAELPAPPVASPSPP